MGTKDKPTQYDCYNNALPDEPVFVLLGRDPAFLELVCTWAERRRADVQCGERPPEDLQMVHEALKLAYAGAEWRRLNLGKWRK